MLWTDGGQGEFFGPPMWSINSQPFLSTYEGEISSKVHYEELKRRRVYGHYKLEDAKSKISRESINKK